jgi:hypothetical protein
MKGFTPTMSINLKLLYIVARKTTATELYALMTGREGVKMTFSPLNIATVPTTTTVKAICTKRISEAFGTAEIAILFNTNNVDEATKYKQASDHTRGFMLPCSFGANRTKWAR